MSASVSAADTPPPAPAFDGWNVKADAIIARDQIAPLETKLKAKIAALRNVVYDVKGKRIQINVIVAADAAQSDALYKSLTSAKPTWSVVRKGTVVYELVGTNDAIPEMKRAHDQLAAQ